MVSCELYSMYLCTSAVETDLTAPLRSTKFFIDPFPRVHGPPTDRERLEQLHHNSQVDCVKGILDIIDDCDLTLTHFGVLSHMLRQYHQSSMFDHTLLVPTMGPALLQPSSPAELATAQRALRHLKSLQVDIPSCECRGNKHACVAHYRCGRHLSLFLCMDQLESIDISLHKYSLLETFGTGHKACSVRYQLSRLLGTKTFVRLRSLKLSSFWCKANELCDLLSRHSASLEEVSLLNTNMVDADAATDPETVALIWLNWNNEPESAELDSGWATVAATCAALPRLQGLLVDDPSRGFYCERLSVMCTESIVDIGMNDRANSLAVPTLAETLQSWNWPSGTDEEAAPGCASASESVGGSESTWSNEAVCGDDVVHDTVHSE